LIAIRTKWGAMVMPVTRIERVKLKSSNPKMLGEVADGKGRG